MNSRRVLLTGATGMVGGLALRECLRRPGYVYPVEPRREPNTVYRVFRYLYPLVHRLYPDIGMASDDLARAMVHAGLCGTEAQPSPILENRDIRELAKAARW